MALPFSVGVVISTYNCPQWLEKTLWGYANQSVTNFELIIADDGSGAETAQVIEAFRKEHFPLLKHVWHEDKGFRKTRILNQAIVKATSDYLIFTDQDCIPRFDFIETHIRYAQEGFFLSGGYFRLPMSISLSINKEDVVWQSIFYLTELRRRGLKRSWKNTKLYHWPLFAALMNTVTPAKSGWNGCNASGWRKDMLAINGFNEEMQYGGLDREFGERLFNLGIKSKQIRYSAICLHLDHARPYKKREVMERNRQIRRTTRRKKVVQTPHGIAQA